MKAIETVNLYRYPATVNCKGIYSIFDDPLYTQLDKPSLEYYATLDQSVTVNKQGTGMYMCYCKTKSLASLGSGSICDEYFNQYLGGEAIGELVTVVITVINIIIKFICRILIS